jgi:AcrR family transcriptional regulator
MEHQVGRTAREKILNEAEKLYAENGMSNLSLRNVTAAANVNLASVNYYFSTKQSLVEAILGRILGPISIERRSLLSTLRAKNILVIRPAHVIICLMLPTLRDLLCKTDQHNAFVSRASSDPDQRIRLSSVASYAAVGDEFSSEFVTSAPQLTRSETLLRIGLFCNAIPGTVVNQSMTVMCQQLIDLYQTDVSRILLTFCKLAESVLSGHVEDSDTLQFVTESLEALKDTSTLRDLVDHIEENRLAGMQITPHVSVCENSFTMLCAGLADFWGSMP